MKRLLLVLAALASLAAPAAAQVIPPSQTISVVDSGTQCSVAGSCAQWQLPNTAPSFTVQVTGTLTTVTLTFRGSADGITFFDLLATKLSTGVQATTTTTTGQYSIVNPGIVALRVVGTTVTSGAANLTLTRGSASSSSRAFPSFGSFVTGDLLYASATNTISGLAAVASGQVLASAGTSTAPAWTADPSVTTNTSTRTALATTSTDGFLATNSTAALVGATVQISPRFKWTGNGWDADDAVSRPVRFIAEALPGGTNTVTGTWKLGWLDPITNAITYPLTVDSVGTATALAIVSFGSNLQRGSAIVYAGASASIASGFSTSAPSIVGRGSSFAVTIGATPGVTGTVTFGSTFASVPSTSCTNTITANAVQAVPTTTQVVLNGVWVQGDIIRCITLGY